LLTLFFSFYFHVNVALQTYAIAMPSLCPFTLFPVNPVLDVVVEEACGIPPTARE
jgi:hypothetical protein